MIKVVIFDIGGVTINDPMKRVYTAVGQRAEVSWKRVRTAFDKLKPLIETGKISPTTFWMRLSKMFGVKASYIESDWLKSFKKTVKLNKDVVKIINKVKADGYKVVTLSNTMSVHERLHRKLGHYKFFSNVFLSNRMKMEKPDVRIYRLVAARLDVKPEECVFIDDKVRNVIGARKTGMKAIVFKNSAKLEKDLKKYL